VFWDSFSKLHDQYQPKGLRWAADYDAKRPHLIQVFESINIRLGGGLLLRCPGFWTVHVCYSDGVTIDNVAVRNSEDGDGPSTDGINIDLSRNVLVQHTDISANDDALALKAGRDADGLQVNRATENVVFRYSIVRAGRAGITFGSETSGGFRNIEFHDISVEGRSRSASCSIRPTHAEAGPRTFAPTISRWPMCPPYCKLELVPSVQLRPNPSLQRQLSSLLERHGHAGACREGQDEHSRRKNLVPQGYRHQSRVRGGWLF